MQLESVDTGELLKAGWRAPEVFTAKGRDSKTDIWGVIYRPTNFDPSKKYPVIENIYAVRTIHSCRKTSARITRCSLLRNSGS